jgi:hypothetical protein
MKIPTLKQIVKKNYFLMSVSMHINFSNNCIIIKANFLLIKEKIYIHQILCDYKLYIVTAGLSGGWRWIDHGEK